jgi:pyruvate-ferredoxin/flavodoxin oxidoreductase
MEAEAYDGPSLIIAYSHCIAHGYDLKYGLEQQQAAVDSGHWILYRYNPDLAQPADVGGNGHAPHSARNPFQLDSKAPSLPLEKYIYREGRYRMLQQSNPEAAERLLELAKADVAQRWESYRKMAASQDAPEPVTSAN